MPDRIDGVSSRGDHPSSPEFEPSRIRLSTISSLTLSIFRRSPSFQPIAFRASEGRLTIKSPVPSSAAWHWTVVFNGSLTGITSGGDVAHATTHHPSIGRESRAYLNQDSKRSRVRLLGEGGGSLCLVPFGHDENPHLKVIIFPVQIAFEAPGVVHPSFRIVDKAD